MKSQPAPDRSTQDPPQPDPHSPAGYVNPSFPPAGTLDPSNPSAQPAQPGYPGYGPPMPYPNPRYPGSDYPAFPSDQPGQLAPSYPVPQDGAAIQRGPSPGFPTADTPALNFPGGIAPGIPQPGLGGGTQWAGGFAGEARGVVPFDIRQFKTYLGAPLFPDYADVLDLKSSEYTMLMGVRENYTGLTKDLFHMLYKQPRNPSFLFDKKNTYALQMLEARVGVSKQHYLLGLRGLVLGPLGFDAWLLHSMLREQKSYRLHTTIELIIDRPAADLILLKETYRRLYDADIWVEIEKSQYIVVPVKPFFKLVLDRAGTTPGPMEVPNIYGDMNLLKEIQDNVNKLNSGGFSVDPIVSLLYRAFTMMDVTFLRTVCFDIFSRYSTAELALVNQAFTAKHKKKLTKAIKKAFMFDEEKALMHICRAMKKSSVERDAKLLYLSMKGFGTKDEHLVSRIVRYHWDTQRWDQIKQHFEKKYKKSLDKMVAGETSGDYKTLMRAYITGGSSL